MKTEATSPEVADYVVVRCGSCKHIVYAAHNTPTVLDTETFKEIGKMLAEGCTSEHLSVIEVRKQEWGCKCGGDQ